jgi:ATP-dependent Clp protease ATP-binding subunit ClpA
MTSNAGSEHFRKLQSPLGFASSQNAIDPVLADINKDLERRFPPEFRNRIDQVVIFEPLSKDEVREIALKYLDEVTASLKRWGKAIHIENEALEKLVTDGYSPAYGARFLKRVIDDQIKLPLSQRWKDANHFRATVKDGRIVVEAAGPRLVASTDSEAVAVNF